MIMRVSIYVIQLHHQRLTVVIYYSTFFTLIGFHALLKKLLLKLVRVEVRMFSF